MRSVHQGLSSVGTVPLGPGPRRGSLKLHNLKDTGFAYQPSFLITASVEIKLEQ